MADPGAHIGRYLLGERLAVGGMGELFLARQEGPGGFTKTLAVKRILDQFASDQTFVDMFLNEARLAALLSHPNIVQIFELGEDGESYFLAMEFVAGRSVRAIQDRLRREQRPFPPALAAQIVTQVLQGLHYAHTFRDETGRTLQIIHRDVSPDNVLVSFNGVVKLIDFGVAKAVNESSREKTRMIKGKRAYLSPEQLRGGDVDARTDVFSTGVVLYELLSGRRPFAGESFTALADQICSADPPPPIQQAGVSPALAAVAMKALAKSPEDRFASAEQMATALERCVTSGSVAGAALLASFLTELFGAESTFDPSTGAITQVGTLSVTPQRAASAVTASTSTGSGSVPSARRRAVPLALGAVLALVGLSALAAWMSRAPPPAPASPVAARPPAPPPVQPTPAPPPVAAAVVPAPVPDRPLPRAAHRRGTGRVRIQVKPWAEVVVGGKSLGVTPMEPVELPSGQQWMVLRNPELAVERRLSVQVPSGGEVTVRENLFQGSPR